ncbi:hypothetical protein ACO0R3_000454 [Hanseniaspora guilliermondii]
MNALKQYKNQSLTKCALKTTFHKRDIISRQFSKTTLCLNINDKRKQTSEQKAADKNVKDDDLNDEELFKRYSSYSPVGSVSKTLLDMLNDSTKNIEPFEPKVETSSLSETRTLNVYKSYQEELADSFTESEPEETLASLQKQSRAKSSYFKSLLKQKKFDEAFNLLRLYSSHPSYVQYFLNEDYLLYIKKFSKFINSKAIEERTDDFDEFEDFQGEQLLSGREFWDMCEGHKQIIDKLNFPSVPLKAIYLEQVIVYAFQGKIPENIDNPQEDETLQMILKTVTDDGIVSLDAADVFTCESELSPEIFKILYYIPEFNKYLSEDIKRDVKLDLESIEDDQRFLAESGLLSSLKANEDEGNEAIAKFVNDFIDKHKHLKKTLISQQGNEVISGKTLTFLEDDVKNLQLSNNDKFEILKFLTVNRKTLKDDSWIEHFVSIDTHGVFGIYKCIPYENKQLRERFSNLLESLNLRRQLEIENACSKNGIQLQLFRKSRSCGTKVMNFKSLDMLTQWQLELSAAVEKLKGVPSSTNEVDLKKYEILNELSSESIAIMGIFTLVKEMTFYRNKHDLEDFNRDFSLGVSHITKVLGQALTFEYSRCRLGEDFFDDFSKRKSVLKQRMYESYVNKQKSGFIPSSIKDHVEISLGATVLDLILSNCTVTAKNVNTEEVVQTAAFNRTYASTEDGLKGILTLHPIVVKKLSIGAPKFETNMHALPMLRQPRDWTDGTDGGYLSSRTLLLRLRNNREQKFHLIKSFNENPTLSLDILEGVNTLSRTAWTINQSVYEVVTKLWNTGKEFADIPPANFHEITDPKNPNNVFYKKLNDESTTPGERRHLHTELSNMRQKYLSIRSTEAYKLVLAQSYMGERFYFPHTLDFRGRAYPINVYLNQLGNDLSRGLLLFWEGKKLGPDGLDWLMIHMGNTCGLSKKSFADRIKFVKENLDEIRKDAKNPLRPDAFWIKADDPFQCLSTVFEIVAAYDCPDGVENYICHLPVHQDGSCNGLQHYAALGRDKSGAKEVNLLPSDAPQDVYSTVAKSVNQKVYEQDETKNELKEVQKSVRQMLPEITRKICKQPVMTTVYGVTKFGAKNQVAKQLLKYETYENDKPKIMRHSVYLTEKIFSSLNDIFNSATYIQDWLGIASNLIAKSVCIPGIKQLNEKDLKLNSVSTLMWTTPLGLRVVHPYRNESIVTVNTSLQSVKFTKVREDSQVNVSKQSNAFPPNYIHSLDASHMLLTAVECTKRKIQFSSVHDSYWSLPGDAKELGMILREKFVYLHQTDLIAALKSELESRYAQNVTLCRFFSNSPISDEIREYRFNFRQKYGHLPSLRDELTLESVRNALMKSPNVESRKKGAEMVTVLSIVESYTDEEIKSYIVPEKNSAKMVATTSTVRAYLPMKFPNPPPKGDFMIEEVLDSKYFFS